MGNSFQAQLRRRVRTGCGTRLLELWQTGRHSCVGRLVENLVSGELTACHQLAATALGRMRR